MSVIEWLLHGIVDFVLYIAVDAIAKSFMTQARDWQERRDIWLKEAFALLILAVPVTLHHTPYILFVLIAVTITYAFIRSSTVFERLTRYMEFHFETWWNYDASLHEHRQREISHLRQQELFSQPQTWRIPLLSSGDVLAPTATSQDSAPKADQRQNVVTTTATSYSNANNVEPAGNFPAYASPSLVGTTRGMYGMTVVPRRSLRQPSTPPSLHPFERIIPVNTDPCFRSEAPAQQALSNITHKIQSLASNLLNRSSVGHPTGLRNADQNVCFANSSLQLLAHSPNVADVLFDACATVQESKAVGEINNNVAIFFERLTEIVQHLAKPRDEATIGVLDAGDFREAARVLGCQTFDKSTSTGRQQQQDAAEFLQWMLTNLHELLTVPSANSVLHPDGGGRGLQSTARHPCSPMSVVYALSVLHEQYGNVSSSTLKDWTSELELACSIDPAVYGEALAHLANADWLAYKKATGNSPISDLFESQLISVQQCLECGRLTTVFEPFSILTLPIARARQQTGLVSLQDCLEYHARIQQLSGENRLQCQYCNRHSVAVEYQSIKGVTVPYSSTPLAGLTNGNGSRHGTKLRNPYLSPIPAPKGDGVATYYSSAVATPAVGSSPVGGGKSQLHLQNGLKRLLLHNTSPCLVIQLLRFTWNDSEFRKISRPVTFPLRLSLRPFTLLGMSSGTGQQLSSSDVADNAACTTYELYAFVVHKGGEEANAGHYVAYAASSYHRWHCYDDEEVREVSIEYEISTLAVRSNVYVLCYRRLT